MKVTANRNLHRNRLIYTGYVRKGIRRSASCGSDRSIREELNRAIGARSESSVSSQGKIREINTENTVLKGTAVQLFSL